MDADLKALFDSGLETFEATVGVTFTWQGVEYTCVETAVDTEEPFDENGKRTHRSVTLEATISQFEGDYPMIRQKLVYGGRQYGIRSLALDDHTLAIRASTVAE